MKILVVDVGGTHVKFLTTGQTERIRFPSGPAMTPGQMVEQIHQLAGELSCEAVSIGYPGVVKQGRIVAEPVNLGAGWVSFDFAAAFGRPVKLINDAAMQALGSYAGGVLLFLGLGTGLGSAMIVDGQVIPMELSRLAYKHGELEDYLGQRGLDRMGKKKWRRHVAYAVDRLKDALIPDDLVIGGGNIKALKEFPVGCRAGNNDNAFLGGFRMWEPQTGRTLAGDDVADGDVASHDGEPR